MNPENHLKSRRAFLAKTGSLLVGSFFGLNRVSSAFAMCSRGDDSKPLNQLVLIIDDIGFSRSRARLFLDLDVPLTFSILPRLPLTETLASEIHGKGHEIMLHQPMEPFNAQLDPGPGALYLDDKYPEIVRTVKENLYSVPFAQGVNNHMGSRFTESYRQMNRVLGIIKNNGLFFVDSMTSHRSTGYHTARQLHIASACRNVFLDNRRDASSILFKLKKLRRYAMAFGSAVGIGHPHPETADAIHRFLNSPFGKDLSLVQASRVVHA